ncbi:MAG: di-trans,poly-cis-decaprenylcistransferase, partial [Cellvibrionaceae bacterium]|nr:di-trans,poly-cis-decaprenylcistransferase [Cellvibrionaceae bacterium]
IDDAESIADTGDSTLVIAADYGGCWDIVQAAKALAEKVAQGSLIPEAVTEEAITENISTAEFPPLDLLIRTGGEKRISNFLLWQAAYAELYFSELLWPEFDGSALKAAKADYLQRQRRFGKTGDQVSKEVVGA